MDVAPQPRGNSLTMAVNEITGRIYDALASDTLFPNCDISACSEASTLDAVQADTGVQALLRLFSDASLHTTPGFNLGTGAVSLRIRLPDAQALIGGSESDCQRVVLPTMRARTLDPPSLVLWTMLGILFEQHEIESTHAHKESESTSSSTDTDDSKAAKVSLLANRCLHCFGKLTRVAIVSRELSLRTSPGGSTLKLIIQPLTAGITRVRDGALFSDDGRRLFTYCPAYTQLAGLYRGVAGSSDCSNDIVDKVQTQGAGEDDTGHATDTKPLIVCNPPFSRQVKQQQLALTAAEMVGYFWRAAAERGYAANETLRDAMSEHLNAFFVSGLSPHQSDHFRPSTGASRGLPSQFYLHGRAGVGKSTFVGVLGAALQSTLRAYVRPGRRVVVVKVPLNAVTKHSLRAVLHVRGISDWSIERVLEQTIAKGHLAVLHLEEGPASAEQQDELFAEVQSMVKHIAQLYPGFDACILYVVTSNHLPSPAAARRSRTVQLQAPSADEQLRWCSLMLSQLLQRAATYSREHDGITLAETSHPQVVKVEVDLHGLDTTALLPADDLRELKKWLVLIGFHVSEHMPKLATPVTAALREKEEKDELHVLSVALSGTRTAIHVHWHCSAGWVDSGSDAQGNFELLTEDGTGYRASILSPASSFATAAERALCESGSRAFDWGGEEPEARQQRERVLRAIIMTERSYLRPGVIVLTGASFAREMRLSGLVRAMRQVFGARLREADIVARSEDHKDIVHGRTQEINGGLFGVIAAARAVEDAFVLVSARVNEYGQYLLREMLEDGESRTHRQAVSLERVLFVLSIDDFAEVAPQTLSRAHDVISCDGSEHIFEGAAAEAEATYCGSAGTTASG